MKSQPTQADKATISTLNGLLRGELSAVETYNQAIKQLAQEPIRALVENRDDHARRVGVLTQQVTIVGGNPETSSGVWGSFAKLVEKSASLAGRKAIIAALEEGEDRGLADYRKASDTLDASSRRVVDTDLLPAQKHSHARMSELKQVS